MNHLNEKTFPAYIIGVTLISGGIIYSLTHGYDYISRALITSASILITTTFLLTRRLIKDEERDIITLLRMDIDRLYKVLTHYKETRHMLLQQIKELKKKNKLEERK